MAVESVHIGNITYYPIYLSTPFPRSLEVDLEGSSTFPILMLSMHIDRFGLLVTVCSAILPYGRVAGMVLQPSLWKLGSTKL